MKRIVVLIIVFYIFTAYSILSQYSSSRQSSNQDSTRKIYPSYLLDEQPEYIGGKDSLNYYLNKYMIFPSMQLDYEGVLIMCLVINSEGKLINIFIPGKTEEELFSQNAKRFSNIVSKWTPGKIKGKSVISLICLPILYKKN